MTSEKNSDEGGGNLPVLTVSELSQALKRTVEDRFGWVRVRGEISGFKRHSSGHLYFSLKDSESVLAGVCWKGVAGRLGLKPEDGMEVIASGRLTTYPGQSKYQIVVEAIELAGQGALLKLLEDRKRKLAAEGLFDAARKKPLPWLPEVIGVITSPTGAVIRDILHRLADRFPRHVLLWPVAVQGENAAPQIAAAIKGFNAIVPGGAVPRPDLLIVARGGGSLEDLWAFNEEIVVRAAAASAIPLIAAVGHETDVTLIDYAADVRAPTPSAAAEMAVPVRMELLAQVRDVGARLVGGAERALRERRLHLDGLARGLPHPRRLTEELTQKLDDRAERLQRGMAGYLDRRATTLREWAGRLPHPGKRMELAAQTLNAEGRALGRAYEKLLAAAAHRLERAGGLLESYSYKGVLARGFALITDANDHVVGSAAEAQSGSRVTVTFHDGERAAVFDGAPRPPTPSKRKRDDDGGQGSLL